MSIIILPELLLANFSWSTSVDRVKQCLGVVLKPHWKISKLLCLTNQQSPHIQPFLEWFMFKKSNFIRMLKAPYSWLPNSSIKIWRWLKMNVFVWFIFNRMFNVQTSMETQHFSSGSGSVSQAATMLFWWDLIMEDVDKKKSRNKPWTS